MSYPKDLLREEAGLSAGLPVEHQRGRWKPGQDRAPVPGSLSPLPTASAFAGPLRTSRRIVTARPLTGEGLMEVIR